MLLNTNDEERNVIKLISDKMAERDPVTALTGLVHLNIDDHMRNNS